MEIILTERVHKLGNIGDVVNVKAGFARNFLLPQKKALRATAEAKQKFEADRARIESENASKKVDAEKFASKLENKVVIVVRQAGDSGQLYGSVSTRDVAAALAKDGLNVIRQQITIPKVIKELGIHSAMVQLHADVIVSIRINVALSVEEANAQLQAANKVAGKSYGSDKDKDAQVAETSEENL
jgi:large subunit ribosomal protein L9